MSMKQYHVTGMSCAACQARVEKAVSKVPGVTGVAVSLLTNAMSVEGEAADEAVIRAVEQAGYGASPKGVEKEKTSRSGEDRKALEDHETPVLLRRLISSAVFLCVLMYFSMGHMMWGWPLPPFFHENHVAMGLVQMILAAVIMLINRKFFISGFRGLIHRAPNMDTLVALGSSASFVWSVYALFMMTDAQVRGGSAAAMPWMDEFYFESAAMILTLITVGKMLEARSKGRTTDALKGLMDMAPKTAVLLKDGRETTIPVEEVQVGDLFAVKPGESIPVDGIVVEGVSAVNEAALTGESIPADKKPGDHVSAATINQSGHLVCRASRVGDDTTLSQIIRMVSDAAATKAPIAKVADKVSGVFVPVVMSIALVTLIVWLAVGREFSYALARGISVLVISCPCALGLATPVAIMVGSGLGAKNGILFKTAVSLEETGRVRTVALDKTGTITKGEPVVTDLIPVGQTTEQELLQMACSLECKSEHPLAGAIVRRGEEQKLERWPAEDFRAMPGIGLQATVKGQKVMGGSVAAMAGMHELPRELLEKADVLSGEGKTPMVFTVDGRTLGLIAVADAIKEDSAEAIRELHGMGIRVVMLTGDNERTAQAIGRQAGVDEVIAGVLPDGKEAVIRKLRRKGRTAMVGDGINDAPALTRADIGMAIGAGTDVAIDAADVVLMNSSLKDAAAAIRLSRQTLRNIHENLFWAFFYNVIGIPLAAGVWIPLFGWTLNPMFGAAAMSLSSFCVVSNALRLNLFDPHSTRKDKKIKPEKEKKNMEKIVKIEGMMCPHCEGRMKAAFEALPQVDEAVCSHDANNAVLTLNAPLDDETIQKTVISAGYKYIG